MERAKGNRIDILGKITKWFTLALAVVFIAIGIGILTEFVLPGPYLLKPVQRYVFGGFILAYGVARMIMIYMKSKKTKAEDSLEI